MMRHLKRLIALPLATACLTAPALAEDENSIAGASGWADALKPGRFVPEAPAVALLGLNDQSLATVANPTDFAMSSITHVDDNGRLQWGGAVSGRPYWWGDRRIRIGDYRSDGYRFRRILARTQLSGASTETAIGDENALRFALGVHMQLLDAQDPRMNLDYGTCAQDALSGRTSADINTRVNGLARQALQQNGVQNPTLTQIDNHLRGMENGRSRFDIYFERVAAGDLAEVADDVKGLQACNRIWNEFSERSASAVFGFGTTFIAPDGQFSGFEHEAASAWFSYRHGVPDLMEVVREGETRSTVGSLGFVARYDDGAMVEAPAGGGMTEASTGSASLVFKRERGDFSFELGATWYSRDFADIAFPDSEYNRVGVALSRRLGDFAPFFNDAWAELTYSHSSDQALENEDRIMLQFRCGDGACFNR